MRIDIVKLGRIDYGDALMIQEKLLLLRQQGAIGDIMLLLEHPPVLTLGTRGDYGNVLLPHEALEAAGVKIYEVSRGGDVTYHGPGQVVGYPIMDLNAHGRDIKDFVTKVEETFISLLREQYGIVAERDEKKYTGVWVGSDKITAIGIAVKRWVTMHGFAFNVNTQLEHFKWINPCGITDKGVTSLQKLTGQTQDFHKLTALTAEYFCKSMRLEPVEMSPEEMQAMIARNGDGGTV